jgi:glycosyltransferase involved in cell wall biosynthesis
MVPTFNPDEKLRATLRSVLAQGGPPESMQIALVDDGSRPGMTRELLRSVDRDGRIELHEFPHRLGLAGNWNRAIGLARGELVHLLHQDDYVLPGFYAAIDRGFLAAPEAGMAFCRSRIVDAESRPIKSASRLRWLPGLLPNWLPRIAERQRIQTPAAVVRRAVYETLGGYHAELLQTLDWEMWVRIAARYPVWYEPQPLAVYRRHPHNESARLAAAGCVWPDILKAIEINAATLPHGQRMQTTQASARWHAASACRDAERLLARSEVHQAAGTLEHVPTLLRLGGDAVPAGTVLKRLSTLRTRISRAGRHAA